MHKRSAKVKESISHFYYPNLTDWEILSAISYCNNVVCKTNYAGELMDISFFFFDGDERAALAALKEVKELYVEEYLKRHAN